MSILRKPFFWAVLLAVGLALTVGGGAPPQGGPAEADAPSAGQEGHDLSDAAWDADVIAVMGDEAVHPATSQLETSSQAGAGSLPQQVSSVGGPTEEEMISFEEAARPRIFTHVVQPGETLSTIAERFEIAQDTILAANDLTNVHMLRVGERLTILSKDGALHRVQRGESLWQIARMYDAVLDDIIELNGITNPNRVMVSDEIFIPGIQAARIGKAVRTERLIDNNGRLLRAFSWPVTGRISSTYGMRWGSMHHGVDVAVPTGTPVTAAAAGRVSFAGWNGGYGYLVSIDHGNRIETRYAHNSRIVVRVGQHVQRGDLIAYSGNTGRSTGPHVHFEIRQNGQSVDPMNYLR